MDGTYYAFFGKPNGWNGRDGCGREALLVIKPEDQLVALAAGNFIDELFQLLDQNPML